MRAFLEGNAQMDGVRNRAQTKKVLDFLRAAAIMEEKVVRAGEETAEDVDEAAADEIEVAALHGQRRMTKRRDGKAERMSDHEAAPDSDLLAYLRSIQNTWIPTVVEQSPRAASAPTISGRG